MSSASSKNRLILCILYSMYDTSPMRHVGHDVSFSCVVKTQRRWSNKIYKTELTKTRYTNQVLGK